MDSFRYINGELNCEGVSLAKIARRVGTPVYVYSQKTLVERFQSLQSALKALKPLICFSMKSNSNLAVCRALVKEGAGLDIVSAGELFRALKVGTKPNKIVFAGVGKTEEEVADAIKNRILMFNVESIPELHRINRVAKKIGQRARVSIRVNPNVAAATHEYIKTGVHTSKFGLDLASAAEIFQSEESLASVDIIGIHVHIGSQITQSSPFVKALKKTVRFIHQIRKMGHRVEWLNIGGGLGIVYQNEKPLTPRQFAKAIVPVLKGEGLKIILEPGRFIAGNAGVLLTQVQYIKENPVKKFAIVDAAMNDLLRPSLYNAYHQILPINKSGKGGRNGLPVDIVGPICESGDFLGKERYLPGLKENDLLSIMSAGAYGFTMSGNYNSRPRACEVMVQGNRFKVIRERETYQDLIKGERF